MCGSGFTLTICHWRWVFVAFPGLFSGMLVPWWNRYTWGNIKHLFKREDKTTYLDVAIVHLEGTYLWDFFSCQEILPQSVLRSVQSCCCCSYCEAEDNDPKGWIPAPNVLNERAWHRLAQSGHPVPAGPLACCAGRARLVTVQLLNRMFLNGSSKAHVPK